MQTNYFELWSGSKNNNNLNGERLDAFTVFPKMLNKNRTLINRELERLKIIIINNNLRFTALKFA